MSNSHGYITRFGVLILATTFLPAIGAQEKQPEERVGARAPDRKDEIAKQQFSLVEQLARLEASLDAANSLINNLPAADSPTVGSKPATSADSEAVLKWPQFYALMAERFHDRRDNRGPFFFTKAALREVNTGDGKDSKETSNLIESNTAGRLPQTDEIDKVYREALDRATTELRNFPATNWKRGGRAGKPNKRRYGARLLFGKSASASWETNRCIAFSRMLQQLDW
jgi:hypothetical protein